PDYGGPGADESEQDESRGGGGDTGRTERERHTAPGDERAESDTDPRADRDGGQQQDERLGERVAQQPPSGRAHGAQDGDLVLALDRPDREERSDDQRGDDVQESLDELERGRLGGIAGRGSVGLLQGEALGAGGGVSGGQVDGGAGLRAHR